MTQHSDILKVEDIRAINIEAASICTAACPFCSRNQKVREYGSHCIDVNDLEKLPRAIFSSLRRVVFAGNFGDFACNSQMVEIVDYLFANAPRLLVGGETNGSVQSTRWWHQLGRVWRHGYVTFALDGLGDTHSLHRRGTDFDAILANAGAFISGGGQAHWKFIAFAHNEDQIEPAAELAQKKGFARFFAISSRDYSGELNPPKRRPVMIKRDCFRSYIESDEETDPVHCKPFHKGSLYLAADGSVHPCCLAHLMYISEHNRQFKFVVPLIEKYHDRINIKTTPLMEIINGPYFNAVRKRYGTNPYCRTRCHSHKNRARRDTVLCDLEFTQLDK